MTTVSPAKPAWDFTLLLERLFWGTVSIVFAVPLFLLVDALGLGGSTEEAALACFLVLAWTGADALCRRSWKALALALPVGWAVLILSSSFRMYRGWELLAPALGSALGLGVVVWRLDGSKFFGAAVALLSGLYTLDVYALVRHFALGNDVFFMAAGGVMHGAAGAVLMVYCRLLGKTSSRRIRFSLGAAVLFVFLLAGEVAGFFALGYGDVFLPFDEARFKAQGEQAKAALAAGKHWSETDEAVWRLAYLACRQGRSYEDLIPFLGKPAEGLDEMGYIYWTFDSGESVLGIAALVENNEFIFGLKSKGRINAICYRDDIRKRAAGLLMLVILAGLTINYLLVWLLERWRIRKAPLQAVPQP